MPKAFFLRIIPGTLTVRYSDLPSLGRRAGQLQRFLGDFQKTLQDNIRLYNLDYTPTSLELWVLSRKDWRHLTSRPYGLSFLQQQTIITPAEYNPRLSENFDELLLLAGQQNLKAPGQLHELFDLLIAFEWAKGNLKSLGLQARQNKKNNVLAAYLFLLVLQPEKDLMQRVLAWSNILALSELKGALKDLSLIGRSIHQCREVSWRGLRERQEVGD